MAQFILQHPNFKFDEARELAKFYALSPKIYTISGLADMFSLEHKQVYRYLKVSIIYSLISKDEADIIIDKRGSLYNKRYIGQKSSLIAFEEMAELSEERKKLQKKLVFFNNCFTENPKTELIKQECISRLTEIERYAFN